MFYIQKRCFIYNMLYKMLHDEKGDLFMNTALIIGGITLIVWILSVIFIYARYGAKPDQRMNITKLAGLYTAIAVVAWLVI
ncbi:hypothetical protein LROSL1_0088 [Furfurilactobacillus rossiae]|nr:hypothetical protein LROSL1_0088 [Furfurilactobacillus rossiae]